MTDVIEYLLNLLGALFVAAICLEFGFSRFQKRKFPKWNIVTFFVVLFGIRGFIYSFLRS